MTGEGAVVVTGGQAAAFWDRHYLSKRTHAYDDASDGC